MIRAFAGFTFAGFTVCRRWNGVKDSWGEWSFPDRDRTAEEIVNELAHPGNERARALCERAAAAGFSPWDPRWVDGPMHIPGAGRPVEEKPIAGAQLQLFAVNR